MKLFLRYQISGTTFLFWMAIFYCGSDAKNLTNLVCNLPLLNDYIISAVALAMPIGVLIHQFSVLIKNWVVAKFFNEFSDFPNSELIALLSTKPTEQVKYYFDKVSNLNSFYYVRVDNGFLAPLMAWLIIYFAMQREIHLTWSITAIAISIIALIYIQTIRSELKKYREILNHVHQRKTD